MLFKAVSSTLGCLKLSNFSIIAGWLAGWLTGAKGQKNPMSIEQLAQEKQNPVVSDPKLLTVRVGGRLRMLAALPEEPSLYPSNYFG